MNIAVIGGDGTGPEVAAEGVKVLKAVAKLEGFDKNLKLTDLDWGGDRYLKTGEALPADAQRRTLRREAAASFRQFVLESPDRDEAPEATLRAAELYVELDQHALALQMYRLFLDRYGRSAHASAKDLEMSYAELVRLHARLGDYRAAARALVEQSEHERLPTKVRAAAARKARELRKDRDGRGL